MKVFISSLIAGFEPYRAACKTAVTTLRHAPVMAEDFGAQPQSPQIACLQGLRSADVMVLALGERYGAVQPGSRLSATHEEYRDARGRKPVIAFVQEGVSPDAEQAEFIREVQGWEGGLFRGGFRDADDLREGVIRALHDYTLANATGPLDIAQLTARAQALVPNQDRNTIRTPSLALSIVGGPIQTILRPAEIEAPDLADAVHQSALFGENRIFERSLGVDTDILGAALVLEQKDGARIQLDEQGAVVLRLLISQPGRTRHGFGFPALIQETVLSQIMSGLSFANGLLDRIDPTQRIAHVAIAARIDASDHMAWRTQAEQDASPNSGTVGFGVDQSKPAVTVNKPRAALRLDRHSLADDLLVPLRRLWRTRQ